MKREALPELLNLLSPVACNWDLFALQIGVPLTQIPQMKSANSRTGPPYLHTCLYLALEWWVANHDNPVYESMIDVLDPGPGKVTPVMNRALASELREFTAQQRGELTIQTVDWKNTLVVLYCALSGTIVYRGSQNTCNVHAL